MNLVREIGWFPNNYYAEGFLHDEYWPNYGETAKKDTSKMYTYYTINGKIEWRGRNCDTQSTKFYDEQGNLKPEVSTYRSADLKPLDIQPVETPRELSSLEQLLVEKGVFTKQELLNKEKL